MRRYSVAQARERFAEILDRAEDGEPAVIERRGVRFEIRTIASVRASRARKPRIEIVDPAVEEGQWTWRWTPDSGIEFEGTTRRAKK